jgi:hypothetical protein
MANGGEALRHNRTQEVAGSSPASSIRSISRGDVENQLSTYEPQHGLTLLQRRSGRVAGKDSLELGAGADAELEEHLA